MPDLVPIKVRLLRKADGTGAAWPEFNQISAAIRKDMVWSRYIDAVGISWHYDKIDNLGTGAPEGTACTCVPKDFADEAVLMFAGIVSKMTAAEFGVFYNTRAHAHEAEYRRDERALATLKAEHDLATVRGNTTRLTELEAEIDKALDPDDPTPGVKRNLNKTWADVKSRRAIRIVQ